MTGDTIDTKPNGWTGKYFGSMQVGNPLMASIQGVPWQVRGTDPASSIDSLNWFASGMSSSPSAADGSSQPQPSNASLPGWWPSWLTPSEPEWLKSVALGGTGIFIGIILVVLGIIFFLKD